MTRTRSRSKSRSRHSAAHVAIPINVGRKYGDIGAPGAGLSPGHRGVEVRRISNAGVPGVLNNLFHAKNNDPYSLSCWDVMRLRCSGFTSAVEQGYESSRACFLSFARTVLDSSIWEIGMFIITVYILTGDTWRICYVEKHNDDLVAGFGLFALFVSVMDIILRSSADPVYRFGTFLFWMDVLALYSIMWDVAVLTFMQTSVYYVEVEQIKYVVGETVRMLCLLRLIRLARLVDIDLRKTSWGRGRLPFKRQGQSMRVLPVTNDAADKAGGSEGPGSSGGGTRVGNQFIELTVRKVIIVIVVVCLVFPLLEPSRIIYPRPVYNFQKGGLEQLHHIANLYYGNASHTPTQHETNIVKASVQNFVSAIPSDIGISFSSSRVLYLQVEHIAINITNRWLREINVTMWTMDDIHQWYRPIETPALYVGSEEATKALFLGKLRLRRNALMNLALRGFALLLLFIMGYLFTGTHKLVIAPIQRMTVMVQKLAEDPLSKLDPSKKSKPQARPVPAVPDQNSLKRQENARRNSMAVDRDEQSETALLETALIKISELLQIGFGVAGAEIIARNMKSDKGDDDAQLLGDGKRVKCIFGFTKMEEFTSMCGLLQEDVCTYINTIARIVHENVVLCHGAPNKNTGNAFFCVWKVQDDEHDGAVRRAASPSVAGGHGGGGEGGDQSRANRQFVAGSSANLMADSALAAVVKTRVDITFRDFSQFTDRDNVRELLGDFEVDLNFGLHYGWAIEGALGSVNKIDATYLSPNVNLAARLEAATHQFGVRLLMSGEFVQHLSPKIRELCRNVDILTVKGSELPMEIWTFDITSWPAKQQFPVSRDGGATMDPRLPTRLKELQAGLNPQFRQSYEDGIQAYKQGRWQYARDSMRAALAIMPDDGPTQCILRVVESADCIAPDDWQGFRKLHEK